MNKAVKIILAISIALWSPAAAGEAGYESLFSVGTGARALGMGGGFASLADDASAIFYNPAGLPTLQRHELSFTHMNLFSGTTYDFGAWVYPQIGFGGVGIAYMRVGTDDILRRRNFVDLGYFDFSYSQILIAYGKELEGGISAGVTLKIVNQTIGELSDYGIGMDLGFKLNLSKQVAFGAILRDIVPATIELQTVKENVPASIAGGFSVRQLRLSSALELTSTFEIEMIEQRTASVHAGGELLFSRQYALRLGYDRDNLAFGAGFEFGRVNLDYAYKVMDYVDDSHRFSLSIMIGPSISEQKEKTVEDERLRGTRLIEDERIRQLDFYTEKAETFYNQFRLDSALSYYHRALVFDEKNQHIIGTIAAIEFALEIQREQSRRIVKTQTEMVNLISSYLEQAVAFFDKGLFSAAGDMLELIIDIDQSYPDALALKIRVNRASKVEILMNIEIGRQAEKAGNYFDALRSYARVLELDPDNKEVMRAMGKFQDNIDLAKQLNTAIGLYRNNELEKARRIFKAVLAIDKNEPVALEYVQKIDKFRLQEATLEQLQKDKRAWNLYLDGLRHMRDKKYQKAINSWQRVLEKYPNNINTLNNIEQARLRLEAVDDH